MKTNPHESVKNMTILEHFTAVALQGLLSNPNHSLSEHEAVYQAVLYANRVIEELNNPSDDQTEQIEYKPGWNGSDPEIATPKKLRNQKKSLK